MAGTSRAYFFVSWIGGRAARIADRSFDHARDLANDFFHTPKAATGEDSRLMHRSLDQTRLHERFEILAIAGLVHFFQWDEFERRRVDAIAQATFIGRSVIEYVAKMRIRRLRADFRPNHAQVRVLFLHDVSAFDRLSEARPTRAGIELVERTEQRLSRHHVHI